jgi:hypothetical protein
MPGFEIKAQHQNPDNMYQENQCYCVQTKEEMEWSVKYHTGYIKAQKTPWKTKKKSKESVHRTDLVS